VEENGCRDDDDDDDDVATSAALTMWMMMILCVWRNFCGPLIEEGFYCEIENRYSEFKIYFHIYSIT